MARPAHAVALDGSRAMRGHARRSGDEAIAAARYRLDVARLLRVVAERRSGTSLIADLRTDSATNRCPQTASSNAFFVTSLRGARERAEHGERLRRERYGLAGARQPCVGFIQLEPVEAQPRDRMDPVHARAPSVLHGSG